MDRFKTYNATGIAPNGRLYAGDLNLFQDLVAALASLTQNLQVGSIAIGESGTVISHIGTGQLQIAAQLSITGIATAVAGLVYGSFTTTTRNAIVSPPHLLVIFNSTTNQFEYNSGTSGAPVWSTLVPSFGASSVSTSMLQDHAVTTIKIALKAVTATEIADNLKPSVSALATDESLRALGTTAGTAAAGNDSRLSNARTPTGHHTTHEPGGSDPMAVDAAAGVGSLRTLGTGALQAVAGNDSRLTTAAVVATTVAGLGTATDGKIGLIRAGTSPYEFVHVVYDATYGKWISAAKVWGTNSGGGFNGGNTSYNTSNAAIALVTFAWKVLDTAGLKPQLRAGGYLRTSNAASTASARPLYGAQNNNGTTTNVGVSAAAGEFTSTDTAGTKFFKGAWADIDAGFTSTDYIHPGIQVKISNGADVWDMVSGWMTELRWVG